MSDDNPLKVRTAAGAIALSVSVILFIIIVVSRTERQQIKLIPGSASAGSNDLAVAPEAASTEGAYVPQPIDLTDQVEPGTEFYIFREELRQAVQDRDAGYVRSIAAPDLRLSFGEAATLDDSGIDDPNAPFWQYLERSLAIGCGSQSFAPVSPESASEVSPEAAPEPDSSVMWACPQVFVAPQSTADAFQQVYIVSEDVNVRAEPGSDSEVIATLSNEIVQYNSAADASSTEQETFDGWFPIVLPDGQEGYVSSRYAYSPVGYRALFSQAESGWQMRAFVRGD